VDARHSSGDHDGAGQQLLGRERRRQDVVDAEVERLQLRLEVTPPGEAQDRRPGPPQAARLAEQIEQCGAVRLGALLRAPPRRLQPAPLCAAGCL
jgi:hypothetical protein